MVESFSSANIYGFTKKTGRNGGLYVGPYTKYHMRPVCPTCKLRPRAVAYHKYDRIYYRSTCSTCAKKARKQKPPKPRWELSGYKKKMICDRCKFKARYASQLLVYHVDGDLNNSALKNLKSVCKNCVEELLRSDLPWRPGDLEVDR